MSAYKHPIISIISQCRTFQQLKQVHVQTIIQGLIFLYPSFILTKILYIFTALNPPSTSIYYANSIFNQIPSPTTFCYNTIIRVHIQLSSPLSALLLFVKMRKLCLPPDSHTYPFVLKACARLSAPGVTRMVQSQAMKFGFYGHIYVRNTLIHVYSDSNSMGEAHRVFDDGPERDIVSYNTLIAGYVKAHQMDVACKIFDKMPDRDAVSWGTLLVGYVDMDRFSDGLNLFDRMLALGLHPDNFALVGALSACAQLGALERGMSIHDYMVRAKIRPDVFLSTALIDMYAKCGCIGIAMDVFESSEDKNVFAWNAMIMGLAMHGDGKRSLELFTRMQKEGIRPDGVTFVGVFVGCSHAGLIDRARALFNEMEGVYGVGRGLNHYGCMVDLLGRSGLIEEALKMIENMPMEGDVYVWGGLLGGCRIHGNVRIAEIAARHLMKLDPGDGGTYAVMAQIYAKAARWEDVARMRRLMYAGRFRKSGCSLIQVDGVVHEFAAGDTWHPRINDICWVLDGIAKQHIQA